AVAGQILLELRHALEKKPNPTPEEQEFVVTMLDYLGQARVEGQLVQARSVVRRVLAARKLKPSPADETKLDACADLATLDRWLEQALTAETAAEALKGRAAAKAPVKAPKGRAAAKAPGKAVEGRAVAKAPARRRATDASGQRAGRAPAADGREREGSRATGASGQRAAAARPSRSR
ncbi:MAG TPA: hypothetical protein VFS00_02105, partial [Polyangiaceae bacterium]|nr:hypothetical protein [Polyangiaceae bacterium]